MAEFINKCKDFFVHAFFVAKDFCIKAFNATKDFVLQCVDYVKANPIHGAIAGAILLLLILTICVAVAKGKAKRKAKKAAKKAKKQAKKQAKADKKNKKSNKPAKTQPVKAEVKSVSMEEKRALELQAAAQARAQKAAEEKARQEAIRKEVEAKLEAQRIAAEQEELALAQQQEETTTQSPAQDPAPVEKTPAPAVEEKPIKAEKPATKKAETAKKETKKPVEKKQTLELYEELKDTETVNDIDDEEDETEQTAKYTGKWLICRMLTDDNSEDEMYFFELHASNGEKLLSSEEYTTYAGALRGIQTHKTNIAKGNFKITLSKKGDYIFKLLSGKNMLLCMGENYPTKTRCENAIESTVRFAASAVIDENVQDHIVKVPKEDETEIIPPAPNGKGKWIIASTKDADGQEVFYFELFANNGEKLLSSEEYTTYIGAINGISTHKANIEKDNFKISLTKRGDYIYKLLNGNGQLLCLGEHYKTKRLCQNAVESVKRFATNSPILTDSKIMQS